VAGKNQQNTNYDCVVFFLEVLCYRGVHITLILHNQIKGERMSDLLKYKLVGDGPKKVIILHDWSVSCEGDYEYALPFFDLKQLTMAFVDVRGYGLSKNIAIF